MNLQDFLKKGLTTIEAGDRFEKFGPNALPQKPPPSWFFILLDQFKSPLIYVLLVAALATFFLGDYSDTVIILMAVFLNTILGFYQEKKAKRALWALSRVLTSKAKVLRDGERVLIDTKELVPGDLVVLEVGDKVPADGVLAGAIDLKVSEAVLTGESMPVEKRALEKEILEKFSTEEQEKIEAAWQTIAKPQNMAFMGTIIASGRGVLLVVKTGAATQMGGIATTLKEEEEETPLEKRLSSLAKTLALIAAVVAGFIFVSGFIAGREVVEMFTMAVALAVAAIPEGLVVSLTVILAIGMQRILKRKALVKRLLAAETLGGVTTICIDKTGTLTEGRMTVVGSDFTNLDLGLKAASLCNNLRDPLEYAMWEWVLKKGKDPQKITEENPRLDEVPFSSKTKLIATLHEGKNAKNGSQKLLFLSGAPEVVLARCQLSKTESEKWLSKFEEYGNKGLRLVGFAYCESFSSKTNKIKMESLGKISWLGVLLYEDPVRGEVARALREAQKAGVRVKVITGDHLRTSLAVLKKLGIKVEDDEMMEGEELKNISQEELVKRIDKVVLFARTDPFEKLKIVEVLKENGEVVAMMGDGVNDAPALKKADIGIVVQGASEVAKETADMVLLDSNFKTIIASIEEGRNILSNLRKVILYLLSDAFGAIIVIFGALVMGFSLPLIAAQILWINLISDGLPSLALTVDPKEKDLMRRPPEEAKKSILNLEIKALIFLVSFFAGASTLVIFWFALNATGDLVYARSLAFALLGANSLFYVFSCRSLKRPVWQTSLFSNLWLLAAVGAGFLLLLSAFYLPVLNVILRTTPLGFAEWGIVVVVGLLVVGIIEGTKFAFLLFEKSESN